MKTVQSLGGWFFIFMLTARPVSAADPFEESIQPLLRDHCLACHSSEKQAGELDLEQFTTLSLVKEQTGIWEHALEQIVQGEMPPKDAKPLSQEHKTKLTAWIRQTLDEVALANAGDPGPVILRRLSNQEYTYTVRDLTGVESLDPAREFPVDGAAGEGFTNTGAALVMSPELLRKYLDAAKDISSHAVLLPNGIRFSPSDTSPDWTNEALDRIRQFYGRHSVSTEVFNDVGGAGRLKSEAGAIPLARYLDAIQGKGSREGLSPKYLALLESGLTSDQPSILLDPLRQKYRSGSLTPTDIERWQKILWRFNTIGHIGRQNGPKSWQEGINPLLSQQEMQVALNGGQETTVFLIAGAAGDGSTDDTVVWENPRIVAKGRPDIPLASVPELVRHLESKRAQLLADAEVCLAAIAAGSDNAPAESLAIWRNYLGFGSTKLEPLMTEKLDGTPDYNFIKGWRGARDLSVLANSSDSTVRIPGVMPGHSIATHPAPDRSAVIAWQAPEALNLRVSGSVVHAHPECGNGVTWSLEVRRGQSAEQLAAGVSQGSKVIPIGPLETVKVEAGQVVALIIGPRDGNHSCDLTSINLNLTNGEKTWDLANDVSPNILAGNPHGPWHFLSQSASQVADNDLPAPMVEWRKAPSAALAAKVREHLEKEFPLTHPLLSSEFKSFRPSEPAQRLTSQAPSVLEIPIPAALSTEGEFVVTGKLTTSGQGSVQLQVSTSRPESPLVELSPDLPVIVSDGSMARQRFEAAFDEFRALFPGVVCYSRIVPIDEVVTLVLYYREDDHLQRLLLNDKEIQELNQLWDELLFVSEAPLKQVAAFEQIYQFATQDRADLVKEFESLRAPIHAAAAAFKLRQQAADQQQRLAAVEFAEKAWRRPLSSAERSELLQYPPRLLLTRALTSPAFLYRIEAAPEQTGPINDWELATRLSYFLWSSLPDDELRSLAAAGQLHEPDMLAAQARRMLQSEKIRRLATEFGCQWLHVRDVATLDEKSERHFPTFVEVRAAMQEEVTRFFIDLFQNNLSALALLDADYTFVNRTLAEHYGFAIEGDGWQRIDGLRDKGRGGILGFSATLAKHSGASRTSAILRGTWLSEVVLGDKLPNPPKGVPVLPEEPPEGLTERQLIERHSSDERCAGCHKRIDPFGFALEGFDAIGRIRRADTKTTLQDGTAIEGLDGLRRYLITQRRDDFLRQFHRKLLGYALGRSVQLSDQPLLENMLAADGQRVADLVEWIVRSPQFREIRGRGVAAPKLSLRSPEKP